MIELKINTAIGIGDILLIKAQLDAVKQNYDSIIICPNMSLLRYRDNNNQYHTFITWLLNTLFSEPPYTISPSNSDTQLNPEDIFNTYGFNLCIPRLSKYLCNFERDITDEYVTISTKTRYIPKKSFLSFKDEFLKAIKSLSKKYRIVLIGERKIQENTEYKLVGSDNMYSIYDYLKELDVSYDDRTVEYLYNTPNPKQFKKDCDLLFYAKNNIILGVGGGFCLAVSINNILGYREDDINSVNKLFQEECPPLLVTKNFNNFIDNVYNM